MALLVRRNAEPARLNGLGRWDPSAELDALSRRLGDLMGDVRPTWSATDSFMPTADIEETDDAYLFEIELPGVKKQDVNLNVAARRVTVSGERVAKERSGVVHRSTRVSGKFRYEAELPTDVDAEKVEAELKDGVLMVRVPKAQTDAGAKRIEIR